ncbi:MAG: DUF5050 domain-containing protein [Oscillospiraceae bacterium]|nr:DUF5050 domain-containing protein [Oscillospiraceae bacterium]
MKRTFAFILAVIFLLTACGDGTLPPSASPTPPSEREVIPEPADDNTLPPSASPTPPSESEAIPPSSEIEYNFDAANVVRGGRGGIEAVTDGDWIYYSLLQFGGYVLADHESFLYRKRGDGSDEELIYSTFSGIRNLNAEGDWIYFTGLKEGITWALVLEDGFDDKEYLSLYRIRTDGTEMTPLAGGQGFNYMYVLDGWIYYGDYFDGDRMTGDGSWGMYRVRTDGTEKTLLTSNPHQPDWVINIIGDWIYYYDGNSGDNYKIRRDGTDKQKIAKTDKLSRIIIDGWSYFEDGLWGERHISKINMQTDEIIQLNDGNNYIFDVSDGWLYYNVYNYELNDDGSYNEEADKSDIYKMRTDGTEITLVTQESFAGDADYIIAVGDWLYVQRESRRTGHGPIFRIKTDGTEYKELHH